VAGGMKNKGGGALRAHNFACPHICQQRQAAEAMEGSSLLVIAISTEEK
jgi:hypothetical protein